ncbi:MAG: hypothetical protein WKF90_09950, partial [Pyrinomonadaceae bacterium]
EKFKQKSYFYKEMQEKENFKQTNLFARWIKRFGVAGFLFFLIKGLLWLIVPALIGYFAW